MAKSCVYAPKKGTKTFYRLKRDFGYDTAWKIYGVAVNSEFLNDFKDSLTLDSEGVPSYESLMANSYIKNKLGDKVRAALEKKFVVRDDTLDNFSTSIEEAASFNKSNDDYVAVVNYDREGKLKVEVLPNTEENAKLAQEQYASYKLNTRLANILSPLGVTVGILTEEEVSAGRAGVTDFSIARRVGEDSISMVKVANNMEGARALSEEFSHVLLRALKDNPLVKRALNTLNNEAALQAILGEDYEDIYNFYDGDLALVAEEALGQLLQKNLLEQVDSEQDGFIPRIVRFIQNKFKRIKMNEVEKAIADAEASMSDIAKGILNSTIKTTQQNIRDSQENVQFNSLSDRVGRNIAILKSALKTEVKRGKIRGIDANQKALIGRLTKDSNSPSRDTTEAVLNYAQTVLTDLRALHNMLSNLTGISTRDKFNYLRGIRTGLESYGSFVKMLNDAALDESNEADNDFLRDIEFTDTKGNKHVASVREMLKELNDLYEQTGRKYLKEAIPAFAKFLEPVLGSEVTLELGKKAGQKVTIQYLLENSEADISFLDRWLDSMGNSSDILLRAFDKVYKNAMDTARLNAIKKFKEIQALRIEAEKKGITSFDWLFEKYRDGSKTGNYIGAYNYSQFERDRKEYYDSLDEKYGKNAKGDAQKAKLAAKEAWLNSHAKYDMLGNIIPNESYKNKTFTTMNDAQKSFYDKFMKLKSDMDSLLPEDKVDTLKAIQLRKDGVQRFIDSASSPSSIWSNIKEHLKSEFATREDDQALFGETTKKGITGFDGREFEVLPALYTARLQNPDELSDDVFASLMAYTAGSLQYHELDNIIDALEVGRGIVRDNRKVKATRGNLNILERFRSMGTEVENAVYEQDGSNIVKRLDDFFSSQIYHKYLKDSGDWEVFGTKLNKNKLVSALMRASSAAQLGFNVLTNLGNVVTGISMQNIEAAGGRYFGVKELASADKEYMAMIPSFVAQLNSRNPDNKLALFDELFEVRQNFNQVAYHSQRKSWLARIFGEEIAYLGQTCGDHWLYNRTALAMVKKQRVIKDGKEMSLWDALEIIEPYEGTKQMVIPDGVTYLDGTKVEAGEFSRRIAHINQNLFGIYNSDDRDAAQRVIAGRLIMQYRRWMKPQFNARFQKGQKNLDTGDWEEGYYRTFFRVANAIRKGQFQLGSVWSQLDNVEKSNIRKGLFEWVQLAAVCALNAMLSGAKGDKDKKRPWARKLAEYAAQRAVHELGTLAPSTIMLEEGLKTVKSPSAAISTCGTILTFFNSALSPSNYTDEIESGKYKGMSTIEKNFYKLPLPILNQYKQFQRVYYDLDESINYYARPATF